MNNTTRRMANGRRAIEFSMMLTVFGLYGLLANTVEGVMPWPAGDTGYRDAGDTIYLDDELTEIYVTMSASDLNDCLANPHSDVYKTCSVRVVNSQIDETVYNVGIRPRGNTSRDALKKSWKLSFNALVPGREFHGVEKFNINGEHNDVSITRSKLSWDLFNRMHVPSPRAAHVYLKINDGAQVEGVFINVEQIDDEFIAAWFGEDTGNLYKCLYKGEKADLRYVSPGTAATYENLGGGETYQEENNEDSPDYTDLAQFIDFINNTDDATFAAGIIDWFSVDNFLRVMAVDVAIGNWDNYWYGSNNYYLYHDQETDRFEYIPYDMDNTYGVDFFGIDWANRSYATWGDGGYGSTGGQLPPLVRRILNIPEYEEQYRRYLRELVGVVTGGGSGDIEWSSYTDTVGDIYAGAPGGFYDITSVGVGNDANDLYVTIRVNGGIAQGGSSDGVKYLIFFNTRSGGNSGNPWGRAVNSTVYHDFFIGSWVNGGGSGQFWEWIGSWKHDHGISIDLSDSASGVVRYQIPLDDLGVSGGDTFTFDVVACGESSGDPGLDHLSNPSISTPDGWTPSVPGPYRSYTVSTITVDPPQSIAGAFTLEETEDKIDAIQAMLSSEAYMGSFSNGTMDYGFDNGDFNASFTWPDSYSANNPWNWGIKPYIEARTTSLRNTVAATSDLPELYVNEMLAFNCTGQTDEAGDYEDWVEIYNGGNSSVDLGGMYLTDDPGEPKKWQFPSPTVVPAGGFVVVWCDDEALEGSMHASFKLSMSGEGVGIYHDDAHRNVLIDYLSYPEMVGDVSFGRYPDGGDDVELFTALTPGSANDNGGGPIPEPDPVLAIFINEWMAKNDSFMEDPDDPDSWEDWVELYNDEEFAVDMSGMYLTDNLGDKTKYQIPDGVTIPAKGFLYFWTDDDDEQGPLHTNFKLSVDGEEIGLFDSRSNCLAEIDTIVFGEQTADISEGRYADGKSCIKVLSSPSIGASNMLLTGDADDDGDVDQDDYSAFAGCLAGPDGEVPAGCGECVDGDLDDDGDTDLADFALLQANFGR